MIRNTLAAWGTPARWLHWIVATGAGADRARVGGGEPAGVAVEARSLRRHKSIGLVVLALVVVRMLWRLANPAPAPPAAAAAWERRAARASHVLLYRMLIALPVTGWILNSAANIPFRVFRRFPLPAIVPPDDRTAEFAARAHLALFVVLAVLLAVHVGAALWHHFVGATTVLTRMLGGAGRRA